MWIEKNAILEYSKGELFVPSMRVDKSGGQKKKSLMRRRKRVEIGVEASEDQGREVRGSFEIVRGFRRGQVSGVNQTELVVLDDVTARGRSTGA